MNGPEITPGVYSEKQLPALRVKNARDLKVGEVLREKDSDKRLPIAQAWVAVAGYDGVPRFIPIDETVMVEMPQ